MDCETGELFEQISILLRRLSAIDTTERIELINRIRLELSKYSPFNKEPVDCIQWKKFDEIIANDYNPNAVAPPEMTLLEHSIREDGYTQPIVAWLVDGFYQVIDGFHRNRVGREIDDIKERIIGYLPLTIINKEREGRGNRIASTIRHNRARGKHQIDAMAEIVLELKRRNWSDKKIGKELGMDPDEVLRLAQITGLADMFSNKDFSEAWEADTSIINEDDNIEVPDSV
jgi:ParB-like chromosome segregation protein Spo0J